MFSKNFTLRPFRVPIGALEVVAVVYLGPEVNYDIFSPDQNPPRGVSTLSNPLTGLTT